MCNINIEDTLEEILIDKEFFHIYIREWCKILHEQLDKNIKEVIF